MLSLEQCRTILQQNGNKYTLEETKQISNLLLELIELQNIHENKYFSYDKQSGINDESFNVIQCTLKDKKKTTRK